MKLELKSNETTKEPLDKIVSNLYNSAELAHKNNYNELSMLLSMAITSANDYISGTNPELLKRKAQR